MAVYVDESKWKLGRMKMCHMTADTSAQLSAMAKSIGLNPTWLQHPGQWNEHYDISLSKRRLAVRAGAIEVTSREMVKKLVAKRNSGGVA